MCAIRITQVLPFARHGCDKFRPVSADVVGEFADMTGRIDDPLNASEDAWPEEPEGLGEKFGELALRFLGLVLSPATIVKILKDQFFPANKAARIKYLFDAMAIKLKDVEAKCAGSREKLAEIRARLEEPAFQSAVATACEEAARSNDFERIKRFALVLASAPTPDKWSTDGDDIATFIRDLSRLGERDIQVLNGLCMAFGGIMLNNPDLTDSSIFTSNNQGLENVIMQQTLHRDDFYSTFGRLIGFGLAIEEPWPIIHTQPHARCIRPIRRGIALLHYLGQFGAD
jgi:hypothetical protein